MARKSKLEFFKNRKGEYQFRFVASNGNIVFTSGDGYKSKQSAKKAWSKVALSVVSLNYEIIDKTVK